MRRFHKALKSSFILVFLSSSLALHSQDTNIVKYLPLKVGNVWVYTFTASCFIGGPGQGYYRYKITDTILINGKLYYVVEHSHIQISGSNYGYKPGAFSPPASVRVDSVSGNIYKSIPCNSITESLVDSLRSKLGDTAYTCNSSFSNMSVCFDTSSYSKFGTAWQRKSLGCCFFEGGAFAVYLMGIGIVDFDYAIPFCSSYSDLIGCIINGVVYGDTSFPVGINKISSGVPVDFSLSQNYPNPFNPSTKIRFAVPSNVKRETSNVKLIIYDILGREVAVLVNEELSPGTYEVDWDGSNYPSGVYYYQLTVNSDLKAGQLTNVYSQTRRMVLVK